MEPRSLADGREAIWSGTEATALMKSGDTEVAGGFSLLCGEGREKNPVVFDAGYLARLRCGEHETAAHFNNFFRKVIRAKVCGLFGREREEELVDKIMAAALERILLHGQPRDANCLAAYVRGICSNLTKVEMRPRLKLDQLTFRQQWVCDDAPTMEERLMAEERAAKVKTVLGELGRRDQAVLVDLFYYELERAKVCRKHEVTPQQLRLILFRARRRFQAEWGTEGWR